MTFVTLRKKESPIVSPAFYMTLINGFTACYTACIVFGYLGHYSYMNDIELTKLPIQGPGLVFMTFPAILA
jgi:SNF family Na+-dependent transporter